MLGSQTPAVRMWDPIVRITHWTVAGCIILNFTVIDEHSEWHEWIGYTALAMFVLRVIWGLTGTERARFSSFLPDPKAAMQHMLTMFGPDRETHDSHNPLGALMVYALWAFLFFVGCSGILLENIGGFSVYSEFAEEFHEVTANLLIAMAFLHVGGVVLETRLSGVNLIRQMTFKR